jgi:two-component system phosphate regulon response regulator PhoB
VNKVSKKILVVEDDANISKLVQYNLEKSGYSCIAVDSGEKVFPKLSTEKVDLILLDIMLPGADGLDVIKRIKLDKRYLEIPVIMLTAKGEESDRVTGFELGADDYVVKPFSPRELILRVQAVLKRMDKKDEQKDDIIEFEGITINLPKHEVKVDGSYIELTSKEFDLLYMLLNKKGRVLTRGILLQNVWGLSSDIETRTVDTHVKRLRKKIGRYSDKIETVRGVGYRFSD